MNQEELLTDATASYLTSLFATAIEAEPQSLAPDAPFAELGVNSFHVLKITKELEGAFGVLPKTLLFERFNVQELATYFVEHHHNTVADMFAERMSSVTGSPAQAVVAPAKKPVKTAPAEQQDVFPQVATPETPVFEVSSETISPKVLREAELADFPEVEKQVQHLFSRYKNETSVSRGTRDIAPYIFFGSKGDGYFNFSLSKNILLVYAYTGAQEYLAELAAEIQQYCLQQELELNLFSDHAIKDVAGIPYSATPFGVVQRITDLQNFSLTGGPMRRLRYQVAKFEKAGKADTKEYFCGTDPEIDQQIATVIDLWCESRTMVNPLIYKVKAEILAGNLDKQHRLFVTFLNDKLQNVILISFMSDEQNGYLMDLEFYPKDMPLGGLEFAIVKMIEVLAAEGCTLLSLGGTYGVKLEDADNPDPALEKNLDDLREMNVFNDAGNLQFKNKFRPQNESIFLCRALEGCNPDNVIDIIMMIADPSKISELPQPEQMSPAATQSELKAEPSVQTEPTVKTAVSQAADTADNLALGQIPANIQLPRLELLQQYSFNPLNIPASEVPFDLKTDSWAQLSMPVIAQQRSLLHSQLAVAGSPEKELAEIFPFKHFAIARSGRAAEQAYCQAFDRQSGNTLVPQNLLFPTWLFALVEQGFEPLELPSSQIFQLQEGNPATPDKAGIDLTALTENLAKKNSSIAFVCLELNANACGGHACSFEHLKAVKRLTQKAKVPLVFDATRVLEHANSLLQRGECQGDIWDVVKDILALADAITVSLAKDFGMDVGGLVASNDEALIKRVRANLLSSASVLDPIDSKMLALALKRKHNIVSLVKARVDQARTFCEKLVKHGLPVVHVGGNHCVLLDVKQMPAFSQLSSPVASFLAWLYLSTGIRAGAHNVGMQKNTALNQLVRLSVPVGMLGQQLDAAAERLGKCYQQLQNIPELDLLSSHSRIAGEAFADYQLKALHFPGHAQYPHSTSGTRQTSTVPSDENTSGKRVSSAGLTGASAANSGTVETDKRFKSSNARKSISGDIAVIGMAGRYPDAQNMTEFWNNLKQGKDSIKDIPSDRLKGRRVGRNYQNYRGGFISDIDRFDSLFFNISPREAETMDPQERLFLEVAWETLESAGYFPEAMADADGTRRVGVFVGAVWAMYQTLGLDERLHGNDVITNSFLWSIANRISYNMNFTGPSMAVDTACSASLTALYLACESLRNGECQSAIVGGVNLDVHQAKFDMTWAGGALSPDGVCRTFGKGANGYVAGEGIGAILLKPVEDAERDNDNILGVIKSVAVNHGGRTSGFSVPNPKAHSAVISEALQKAEIDAKTISYVEAHGTGTELGDPIEISGLNDAYKQYGVPTQSCAIGSVKTNIGHLEAAAGLVGVSKILLQMQHQQIVPSLHSAELNEHIDFTQSPFVVQQELKPWQLPDGDSGATPLRAGLSSFGAGGSNAHVIVEQYQYNDEREEADQPYIVPLSAKTEKQVYQMAERLLAYVKNDASAKLADIAYTLQVGRKSFEHRLALVAQDKTSLITKLECFLNSEKHPDVLLGHVKNADNITTMLSKDEKQNFVTMLLQGRDNHRIARLWLDGLLQESAQLTPGLSGKRVPLPTYPFADKRHWAAQTDVVQSSGLQKIATHGVTSRLHPMLDSNESTFQRQLFKKRFTEDEFFIYDHLVSDIPTLPGVAYLDMVRQAGELAAGMKVHQIRNIIWLSPLTVENGVPNDVFVELIPKGDLVQFEVFSEKPDGGVQIYAQGKLQYVQETDGEEQDDEYIDLETIKARCTPAIKGPKAYPLFKSLGLHLGHAFQVIQEVYKNDDEVLGQLSLPEIPDSDNEDFVLHPSLVDGSFQALMGAQLSDEKSGGGMVVPYSLGIVEIRHPLTPVCYSYVTEADPSKKSNAGLSKKNCSIVDETGKVLVKVYDSVGVPLTDVHEKPGQEEDVDDFATLYYNTQWLPTLPETLASNSTDEGALLLFGNDKTLKQDYLSRTATNEAVNSACILVLPGTEFKRIDDTTWHINASNKEDFKKLFAEVKAAGFDINKVAYNWYSNVNLMDADEVHGEALQNSIQFAVYSFMYLTQVIITEKLDASLRLIYLLHSSSAAQPHQEAIEGYMTILRAEAPKLACKMLNVPAGDRTNGLTLEALQMEFNSVFDDKFLVQYQNKERRVRQITAIQLQEKIPETNRDNLPVRQRGVYLITGGTGGLGMIFAQYLASEYQARIVLTARSALKEDAQQRIAAMQELGAEVLFVQADVSTKDGAQQVVKEAQQQFGQLHGIIHSAGTLRDAMVRNKTAQELDAVLAAKVQGTLYLDQASSTENLDFFALFSSLAALAGNAGQSDYSYANRFMDRFASLRNQWVQRGERSGRSVSVNWSIWSEGGMQLDEQTAQFFKRSLGIKPLSSTVGIKSFFEGLHTQLDHFAVIEGDQEKIETSWGLREPKVTPVEAEQSAVAADNAGSTPASDELTLKVQDVLTEIVMEFLKLESDEVDIDTILVDLGFDSIGLSTFANAVNDKYGTDVTPVLFFEYPNIREISQYLSTENADLVGQAHGSSAGVATATGNAASGPAGETANIEKTRASFSHNKGWSPGATQTTNLSGSNTNVGGGFNPQDRFNQQPIAIVGAAGIMPQADDIHEYWQKLRDAENNMVTVIPEDRWDWREYWGDPMQEENKTLSKWGGFMREVDKFDPLFWGISPREAEMMDPQQRVYLETVWAAIEDSGHKVSELAGTRTGLFVGAATRDYIDLMGALDVDLDGYSASGTSHAILANRISFLLDIHGPSAPLDTACSSSSVALHRAIESIHTGSCEMAIVGGVQVMLTPAAHISFGMAGMLASDGKCKTFDSKADGYVRGEGSGAIVIKPLAMAEEQGDHIYAVVRATAENHGGKATMLTAPNPNAQADLLVEAYQKANIDPTTVGLLECHGTGTSLGDPIEVQAMKKAFNDLYKEHNKAVASEPHIGLTSAKTNIGHLETAAGIAGILKVLMAIKHKEIPALLHFEQQNPYIDLKGSPFYMVDKTRPWEPVVDDQGQACPRRAGVSSFGFGGANVHVVLEEYQATHSEYVLEDGKPYILVVSAKNEERLRVYAQLMAAHLEQHDDNLADIAYTTQVGRDSMEFRLALTATSVEEAIKKLADFAAGQEKDGDSMFARIPGKKARKKVQPDVLNQWLSDYDYLALCDAWLQGVDIDWQQLYGSQRPSRISLPTYPFARERYWFDVPDKANTSGGSVSATQLHPLLHQNTSTLSQQCYSSRFSASDKLLQPIWQNPKTQSETELSETITLTPSHCIDMLRVAIDDATRDEDLAPGYLQLEDLNWLQTSDLTSGQQVHLALFEEEDDEIGFELFKEGPADSNQSRLLIDGVMIKTESGAAKTLDLTQLQSQFSESATEGDSLYKAWQQAGINIAATEQAISRLWHTNQQCLVELSLEEQQDNAAQLQQWLPTKALESLWPVMCHIWSIQPLSFETLVTPVSAEQVSVYHPLSGQLFAWLRPAANKHQYSTEGRRFDIDLVTAKGVVCVSLRGVILPFNATVDLPLSDFGSLLERIYNTSAQSEDSDVVSPAVPSDDLFSELLNKIY
ncbi:MAG: SDR family NAD(P)-dependent oxidoreductase [Aestuariibacter sp.]